MFHTLLPSMNEHSELKPKTVIEQYVYDNILRLSIVFLTARVAHDLSSLLFILFSRRNERNRN